VILASILLLEDHDALRESLTEILHDWGYDVEALPDGKAALQHLRTQTRPDLILLDLMLPEVDGFDFRLVQLWTPELADIPVIVVSGVSADHSETNELRAEAYLTKPVDLAELRGQVERLCGHGRALIAV
jgi:DNA-binding response OmpR family regulator